MNDPSPRACRKYIPRPLLGVFLAGGKLSVSEVYEQEAENDEEEVYLPQKITGLISRPALSGVIEKKPTTKYSGDTALEDSFSPLSPPLGRTLQWVYYCPTILDSGKALPLFVIVQGDVKVRRIWGPREVLRVKRGGN